MFFERKGQILLPNQLTRNEMLSLGSSGQHKRESHQVAQENGDAAIRVLKLSKCYHLYDRPQDRLKQFLLPRLQRSAGMKPRNYGREFWALRDVSFEVNKGEAVAIVGRNGAGKSTLLQMICGTLFPTSGSVEVVGTVAALLELGSGFNPEFTGRENVYLSASVLGLTAEEINDKFDEIAAFADIGDFLEQPIKTYSSGMLMRLAFAVNTCIDPEILMVDEALGVGDAPFQSKCYKRLRKLIDSGRSVLLVSHDIATVRAICSRALWLKNGRAELWGDAKEVSKEYEKLCWQEQGIVLSQSGAPDAIEPLRLSGSEKIPETYRFGVAAQLLEPNPVFETNRQRSRMGTSDVIIKNFIILNEAGNQVTSCEYNEKLSLHYLLEVCRVVDSDFMLGIRLRDLKGNFVYSANDIHSIHRVESVPGDRYIVSADIRIPLTHQDYVVSTAIFGFKDGLAFSQGVYDYSKSVIWDAIEDAAFLTVHPCRVMPLPGPVNVSFDLKITKLRSQ